MFKKMTKAKTCSFSNQRGIDNSCVPVKEVLITYVYQSDYLFVRLLMTFQSFGNVRV